MKRYLVIGAGALALGAAVWSGLWFMGRGAVEERLDARISALEAAGWAMTAQKRKITGFPLEYDVRLETVALIEAESGVLVRLPDLDLSWAMFAPDEVRAHLPESFQVDLPVRAERREANPRLPAVLRFAGTARGLVATADLDGTDLPVVAADALSLVLEQEDFDIALSARADQVSLVDGVTTSAALDLGLVNDMGPGGIARIDLTLGDLSMTSEAVAMAVLSLGERIYTGQGAPLEIGYGAGSAEALFSLTGDPSGSGGQLAAGGADVSGTLLVADGAVRLAADSRATSWEWTPEAGASTGLLTAAATRLVLALPTVPAETPGAAAFGLGVDALTGDDTFWATLDPNAKLERAPASLQIDLEATMRVTAPLNASRPGPPPLEVSNVLLNRASITALGASLEAEGDVEILQPIMIPLGRISVNGAGLTGLIGDLSRAGLLTPDMVATTDAILQVYALPSAEQDTWQTEIGFAIEGITVNGLPVQ